MIGQYVNTGTGRRVTISPAVPGAQYRITAWALGDGRRSATPAVVDVTTSEASKLHLHMIVHCFAHVRVVEHCVDDILDSTVWMVMLVCIP